MDTVSKKERSAIMAKVKSKDSKIEVDFRKKLWNAGIRYRKNAKGYFGKPDIVLKKYKIVIFIDSCFWHGCKKHCRIPTANKKYWVNKIDHNRLRDKQVNRHYKISDWKVIRIWEHDLRNNNLMVQRSKGLTFSLNLVVLKRS